MNENKEENKTIEEKIKKETEKFIDSTLKQGIQPANVDSLFKAVDMYKDVANIKYWKTKEEDINMRYKAYGDDMRYIRSQGRSYEDSKNAYSEDGNYGRRMRDSRGRYMARGYDAKYRGEDMLNDMYQGYHEYSDGREEYGRGNYGAKEDTMKSLDYMLESVVCFLQMLQEEASSQEEFNLIKKYTRKISEM